MNILSGELPETKTYSSRSWVWVGRVDPADLADGNLTVNFRKGSTGRATIESRRYAVQEIPAEMGRTFLVLKADGQPDPNQCDVYEVRVTDFGVSCTCTADQCKAPCCVHKDVLPVLIAAGAFDPPIDPPPAPPVTEEQIDDMAERSGKWFPDEPGDDELPACFQGIGGSPDRAPF